MTEEGQSHSKRVYLNREDLQHLTKEEIFRKWQEQDAYIESLFAKGIDTEHDKEQEAARRENVLLKRLTSKEKEMQEYLSQLEEIKRAQNPNTTHLKNMLLDPAINLMFSRMKRELDECRDKLEQAQNDLGAWKFTPDGQTGKRLMAKCRMLIQENEELGNNISSGRTAKLEGEVALERKYVEEMKASQAETDEFLADMDEDMEGMQSTIYLLQQQLKEAKEQVVQLQTENAQLKNLTHNTSNAQEEDEEEEEERMEVGGSADIDRAICCGDAPVLNASCHSAANPMVIEPIQQSIDKSPLQLLTGINTNSGNNTHIFGGQLNERSINLTTSQQPRLEAGQGEPQSRTQNNPGGYTSHPDSNSASKADSNIRNDRTPPPQEDTLPSKAHNGGYAQKERIVEGMDTSETPETTDRGQNNGYIDDSSQEKDYDSINHTKSPQKEPLGDVVVGTKTIQQSTSQQSEAEHPSQAKETAFEDTDNSPATPTQDDAIDPGADKLGTAQLVVREGNTELVQNGLIGTQYDSSQDEL